MTDIQVLRDLSELSKHNITSTLFDAMNSGTIVIERDEAMKLVRIISTKLDESFQVIAEKETRVKPKTGRKKK